MIWRQTTAGYMLAVYAAAMSDTNRAMIIGATGAIGGAIADQLQGDYHLTLVGRDSAKLQRLKARYGAEVVPCDVSNELEVQALFAQSPSIQVLVYAAGAVDPQLIKLTSADSWHTVMDANLTGVMYVLKHAASKLESARVFVLGARPELVTYRSFSAYAASKAAVAKLVEIAAIELKRKAAFTLVLPKAVDSDFWDNVGKVPQDALEPKQVADAVVTSLAAEPVATLKVG